MILYKEILPYELGKRTVCCDYSLYANNNRSLLFLYKLEEVLINLLLEF